MHAAAASENTSPLVSIVTTFILVVSYHSLQEVRVHCRNARVKKLLVAGARPKDKDKSSDEGEPYTYGGWFEVYVAGESSSQLNQLLHSRTTVSNYSIWSLVDSPWHLSYPVYFLFMWSFDCLLPQNMINCCSQFKNHKINCYTHFCQCSN